MKEFKAPSFKEIMEKTAKEIAEGKTPSPIVDVPEEIKDELLDVPDRYRKASLKHSPIELTGDESLFLFSSTPGTGKTHLAWAYYIQERLKNPAQRPRFTTFGELQLRLRQSMDNNQESENSIIKEYSTRKLVILDDMGGLRPTMASDYSLSMVFEILNNRYSWNRQTIITSNKSLEELEKSFDARIASRIAGWCKVIELEGEDKRLNQGV